MNKRLGWILAAGLCLAGLVLLVGLVLPCFGINFAALLNRSGLRGLQTQPGFDIEVVIEGLDGPRFIAFSPEGELFVAERGSGRIVAIRDPTGDVAAGTIRIFAENLDAPHSLVFHHGSWYVGVPDGVVRLTDLDGDGVSDETVQIFRRSTPGSHNTRTVLFLPDGRMVVAYGSSCNVCEEGDPNRAAITVYDGPGGENAQPYATGLRNAVGLALQPGTGELWATNNGRDLLGDDLPPDEVHRIREGGFYGWPFCHSGRIEDPDLGFPGACDGVVDPIIEIQAHSAPLGLVFYDGSLFPAEYSGDLFVAYHGSWNRTIPTGYKVVRIPFENGQVAGNVEDFAWGWLTPAGISGRPVGLAVGPDGALYISDDYGGRIFRTSFR
jgi:glucose/arabinose dehydrogenase